MEFEMRTANVPPGFIHYLISIIIYYFLAAHGLTPFTYFPPLSR